ncbi:hypothetical protein AVEN_150360-1 [Araneus ventricosus]|uniref:Uncharacterized protein n=1 Tax=Araneus ventricosus TaxID=182803 RepID=A0A4Y2CQ85_ARAVE|nr:hypothetical protein AVEN_150360-1 [Araneus ventricosus]
MRICKRKYLPHAERKSRKTNLSTSIISLTSPPSQTSLPLSALRSGIDGAKRAAAFSKKAVAFSLFFILDRAGGLPKWDGNRHPFAPDALLR